MFDPLLAKQDKAINDANEAYKNAHGKWYVLDKDLQALKDKVDSPEVMRTKACRSHIFEGANLFYSCIQAAIDNYANDHYGDGAVAFQRWLDDYKQCTSSVSKVKDFKINGKPCGLM